MNEPFETSSDTTDDASSLPKPSLLLSIAKPLGCITGGVGMGLLITIGVLCFLLFVVAPALLEWVSGIFSS